MTNFHAELIRLAVFCCLTGCLWYLAKKHAATSDPGWTFMFRGLGLVFLGLVVSITEDFPQLNKFIVLGNTGIESFLKNGLIALGFLGIAIGLGKVFPALGRLIQAEAELTEYQTDLEQKIRMRTAELKTSEERYRTMVGSLQEPYYEVDLEGKFTYVNDSLCNAVEIAEEAILGESYRILFDEQDARAVSEIFNKMYKSGIRTKPQEWKIKTRSGGYRWCEISLDLATDSMGNVVGFKGVSRDITDRKLTQLELEEVQERLNLALNAAHLAVWEHNLQTQEAVRDPRWAQLLGYAPEEIEPTISGWTKLLHPDDRQGAGKALNDYVEGRSSGFEYVYRMRHKSGEWVWHLARAKLVERDEHSNPVRLVGVTLDITEKMRAEEALRKARDELEQRVEERTAQLVEANTMLTSEIDHRKEIEKELRESRERLEMAIETTELGLWEMNIQTGEASYDQRTLATIEFTTEEASPTLIFWGSRCHPDDLYQMRKAYNAHFKGTNPLYHSEYRVLAKSGNWKWVASHGMVVERDEMGNPLRMEGTILDITDRKESEERLKANVREKEVLLREIHHRVKNNLQLMGSMLGLQSVYTKKSSVADVLKDAERRIWSMALVHETLYRSGDLGRRVGSEYFERLLENFQAGQGGLALHVRLEKEIEDVSLGLDSAINCGLIMNELISNCLKHAFPPGAEGTIEISLRSLTDGQTELEVSDDGAGVPDGFQLEDIESFGLDLVRMLVDELNGHITVDTGKGTRFRIVFRDK